VTRAATLSFEVISGNRQGNRSTMGNMAMHDEQDTDHRVTNNRAAGRFELAVDGEVAVLNYERRGDALVFVHTEVPPASRGRGLGEALVKAALEAARQEGVRVVPVCPFVRAYLQRHPQGGSD
jgi:predicted GNAT family acetyltransferase